MGISYDDRNSHLLLITFVLNFYLSTLNNLAVSVHRSEAHPV